MCYLNLELFIYIIIIPSPPHSSLRGRLQFSLWSLASMKVLGTWKMHLTNTQGMKEEKDFLIMSVSLYQYCIF
jgi:hypothetical protein